MWTRFMDMHSGGRRKLSHEIILIEAPEAEAELIFQNRFGRNPHRVTCTCCGSDYSIDESPTLEQATAYDRNCAWEGDGYVERANPRRSYAGPYMTVDEYVASGVAMLIRADEIKPEERHGSLRIEGYVWTD